VFKCSISTEGKPTALFLSGILALSVLPGVSLADPIPPEFVSRGADEAGSRKEVFEGPPFTQIFRDVYIQQDGPLANVSLVFVNSSADGSSWGWKTMQLLKIDGRWKIASEFFTGHRLE